MAVLMLVVNEVVRDVDMLCGDSERLCQRLIILLHTILIVDVARTN